MARLIFLEDEAFRREELAGFFALNQHQVVVAPDLTTFRHFWSSSDFDIAVIDLGLPDGNGTDLIRELRSSNSAVGIVVYTATVEKRLEGMKSGADHYLIKPMGLDEVLAHVDSLARRICDDQVTGTWFIDSVRRELTAPSGAIVSLSDRDFKVLNVLMSGHHNVVSRRQIVKALGEDYLDYDQRRLDTQIRRLRVKTERLTRHKLPVNTVHGVGYQFASQALIKS